MRKSKPHEAIRRYLDSHDGRVEVQVDALLATWKVDDLTDESRRTIEQGLAEGGLATRPALAGLLPEDAITVYVAEPEESADAPGDSGGKEGRGGFFSRLGRRSSPPAEEEPATGPSVATDQATGLDRPPATEPAAPVSPPAADRAEPPDPVAAPAGGSGAAELDTLRSERESLRSERDTLRSELERVQREAASAREEAERRAAEVAGLEQAITTEQQKVSQAEGRTSLAAKAEQEAKSQSASLRGELESARGETASARSEVDTARSELEAARKRQQELEDALARERRPREELERSRNELASARSKAAELIGGARTLVESTTEQLVAGTRAIAEMEIRAGDAESAAQGAARELESHRARMGELERQLATRREQDEEAQAHVQGERARGAQAREAFDAARVEQERLREERLSIQAAVAEAQRGLAAGIFESEFSTRGASENKLEELAAQEERVGRELARVGPEVSRRQAELEQAERRASEVEAKLTEVNAGLPELTGEHAQARGRLQALEEEAQGTRSALERLRTDLREARDGLDTLRIDSERGAAELVEAERRLVEVTPDSKPSSAPAPEDAAQGPAKRRRFRRRRD